MCNLITLVYPAFPYPAQLLTALIPYSEGTKFGCGVCPSPPCSLYSYTHPSFSRLLQHYVIVSLSLPSTSRPSSSPFLLQTRQVAKIDCRSAHCVHSNLHRRPCHNCSCEKVRLPPSPPSIHSASPPPPYSSSALTAKSTSPSPYQKDTASTAPTGTSNPQSADRLPSSAIERSPFTLA